MALFLLIKFNDKVNNLTYTMYNIHALRSPLNGGPIIFLQPILYFKPIQPYLLRVGLGNHYSDVFTKPYPCLCLITF